MASENLFSWLKDTMKVRNITNVNSNSDLLMICQKQHEDIWRHVINNIRPKETVKIVKGNLLLLSNKSKLQQADASLHIENTNFENGKIKKLLNNLKMLKKQYSKIKENNEIVSKNNKDIKEKILIHESIKKKMESVIMDTKGSVRSVDHFKHNLINIHHTIQHFSTLVQEYHTQSYKISSCNGSMSERESLQADMHKLIMEMRKVVMNNSEHIDAERQEMVVKKLLSDILSTSKPSTIVDVLLVMFCKALSLESDKGSIKRFEDDEFTNIKKLMQDKKEYILTKTAQLYKMKNTKTLESINISTNSQDPVSLFGEYQSRKVDLRVVEARLRYLDEVVSGKKSSLIREIEDLKEKKKLFVSKLIEIKRFETSVMDRHTLISKLMTPPPDYIQLQHLISDKVKGLNARECIDALHQLDSVIDGSLSSLTAFKLHHFDMLDLIERRPLALLHTTPPNQHQAIFQEALLYVLSLLKHPSYMSADLVLKNINVNDDVSDDGYDDSVPLLIDHVKECSRRVCEQEESFKSLYLDVLTKSSDAFCMKQLSSLRQVVQDWWHQPAFREGLTRVVDGMTCSQWMDVWKACVVKFRQ